MAALNVVFGLLITALLFIGIHVADIMITSFSVTWWAELIIAAALAFGGMFVGVLIES